jgi:UDP-N-acetylmuramoyl-L-alanyl-D-glutamate--2,6-diaminopimelate ligase
MINKLRTWLRPLFPQPLINYIYHLPTSFLASRMYGNPASGLEIIAVTGTDGKTTTTSLIYHILKIARKKVAMINTIEARIGKKSLETGLHVTTPDPFVLQALLRRFRSQKIRYVVLEVTSHGLDQFRFYPLRPKIAVLTNITHEHLDYHKTFRHYMKAKLRLFRNAEHAVINKDLAIFPEINKTLSRVLFSTYSLETESQLRPTQVVTTPTGYQFRLGHTVYNLPLTGRYNLYNALAAIATTLLVGIPPSDIKRALSTFPGVKGRLEEIPNHKNLRVFVDFAHTPNALTEVLTNLKSQKPKNASLIVIFGAAGLRDASKRPLMGAAASELADKIVLTSEDPRTEDASVIAQTILSGIPKTKRSLVIIELDRQKAVNYAVNHLAKKGDWIVACGKGHEQSLCFGTKETPWSERKALETALNQ